MYLKNNLRQWRIINLVLIIIGLITPWFGVDFDAYIIPPAIGSEFILATGYEVAERLLEYGFEILMFPFMMIALSGILLILYLIVNFLAIIEERKFQSYKMIFIALVSIAISFSFPILFAMSTSQFSTS
jgi:hypothetical protein